MIKFIKKLKENISFYRWAYVNRDIKNEPVSCYVSVNNVRPTLIQCARIVGNAELDSYEVYVRNDLIFRVANELDKILVMEKEDLMNGTSRVEMKFYISPFVEV